MKVPRSLRGPCGPHSEVEDLPVEADGVHGDRDGANDKPIYMQVGSLRRHGRSRCAAKRARGRAEIQRQLEGVQETMVFSMNHQVAPKGEALNANHAMAPKGFWISGNWGTARRRIQETEAAVIKERIGFGRGGLRAAPPVDYQHPHPLPKGCAMLRKNRRIPVFGILWRRCSLIPAAPAIAAEPPEKRSPGLRDRGRPRGIATGR